MDMASATEQKYHPIIQSFIDVAPYMQSLMNDDVAIRIFDTEKLVFKLPARTFNLNIAPGDPLREGDVATMAILENKEQAMLLPAHILGVRLLSRAIPIHDEKGKVIGGVAVGLSVEKEKILSKFSSPFHNL